MKGNESLEPRIASLPESARMLHACVRTVYRLIDDGELPRPIKIRSRSFLPISALRAYLIKQGLPESESTNL
jgi:hypothetical protein